MLTFPPAPNALTPSGEPCHRSACKRYDIVEDPGVGYYAVERASHSWVGISGTLAGAIERCEAAAGRGPRKRKRCEAALYPSG